jgi:hypothetical protein
MTVSGSPAEVQEALLTLPSRGLSFVIDDVWKKGVLLFFKLRVRQHATGFDLLAEASQSMPPLPTARALPVAFAAPYH